MRAVGRLARLLHPLTAFAVVVLVVVQVYLIATYIFGRPGALAAHRTVGGIVVVVEVAVLLTGLLGWWRDWRQIGMSAALVLVGIVQVQFAENLGSTPTVHALHGLLALVVLLLAWQIGIRSRASLLAPFG